MGKFALLVGATVYHDDRLPPLTSPASDAAALGRVLSDPACGAFDQVATVLDRSESDVRKAVASFAKARSRDDFALLYFSCHGVVDDAGALYFATPDTDVSMLNATAVSDSFVRQCLDRSDARQQLFILDCCHSGAFGRGAKAATGASLSTGERFTSQRGGRFVMTASDALQYSWESLPAGGVDKSLFTSCLVEGLESGDADVAGKGTITCQDAYDYVVRHLSSPKQQPMRFGEGHAGDIVLARNPFPRAAALPDDIAAGINDRRPWIRKATVSQLAELTRRSNPGVAVAAATALATLASGDDSFEVRDAAMAAMSTGAAAVAIPRAPSIGGIVVERRARLAEPPSVALPAAPAPSPAVAERTPAHWTSTRAGVSLLAVIFFVVNWLETAFDDRIHHVFRRLLWGSANPEQTMARVMTQIEMRPGNWFVFGQTHWAFSAADLPSAIVIWSYSIAYFIVFPLMALAVGFAFGRRRDLSAYRVLLYAACIDYLFSLVAFLILPVPERWAYPDSGAVLLSDLLPHDIGISFIQGFRHFSALDNCFPSFHVSMTVIVVLTGYLYEFRFRNFALACGLLVIGATYVLGIHWAPDMIAGASVAVASVGLARRVNRRFAPDLQR